MSLLLSQLTPAVDTGPIGFGINCLEFADYLEEITTDENSWFFILEDFAETGPIGTGIYCADFDFLGIDDLVDDSFGIFQLEDVVPGGGAIFLQASNMFYPVN